MNKKIIFILTSTSTLLLSCSVPLQENFTSHVLSAKADMFVVSIIFYILIFIVAIPYIIRNNKNAQMFIIRFMQNNVEKDSISERDAFGKTLSIIIKIISTSTMIYFLILVMMGVINE